MTPVDELSERILQEVSAAASWREVITILQSHRGHYFALPPKLREHLNAQIKDLIRELP